ncbi:hypothetical protein JCM10449v2_001523 [Rhodotorula kratochvilovae]
MSADAATPPSVAAALALRPFKPLTTRRDLATSLRAFRTAWTALSHTQVLAESCTRLGERAAGVLCDVYARLEEVDARERDKAGGKVVLERSYEFQEAQGGAQEGGETIFKIQAAMLDLQSFATDFLAHSTGPSRLDLLVLTLPASQRALSTLTASLSALLTHYALPHPSSPTTWAAEDALDAAADARALPRAFQRAVALRGHAWETFLAERPAPVGGTPGARRAEFVEWCAGRNPLLRAGEGDGAREAAEVTPRAMRRKEGSWPPPASPSQSLGEGDMLGLGIATVAKAPLMRRAASQPAALPHEAVETGAPASEVCSSLATRNSVLATEPDASSEPLAVAHESEHNPPPAAPISPPSPNPSSPLPSLLAPPLVELKSTALPTPAEGAVEAPQVEPAAGAKPVTDPMATEPETEPSSPREERPAPPAQEDAPVPAREAGLACTERAHGGDEHASGSPTPEEMVDEADTPPLRAPTPIEQAETQNAKPTTVSPSSATPAPDLPVILLTSDGSDEPVALTPLDEDRTVPDVVVEGEKEDEVAVSQVVVAPDSPPTPTLDSSVPPSTAPAPASPPALPPAEPLRILALDGGGLLGPVPQLHLLASHLQALPSSPSPAQHFTLIAGTSSSALLAVLLGRLGLSVDTALALYTQIAQRALALGGPPGAAPAQQQQRRKQSRWSRLFRRSSPVPDSPPAQRMSVPEARTAALAKALAELLPGADEPFASPSSTRARSGAVTAILAFAPSSSGGRRAQPRWLRSDAPSSSSAGAGGMTVAQAVLAGAAASPLFALEGWAATPTSLCPAEGAVELARALAGEEGREIELVCVGTGYASLRLPAPSRSSPLSPARRIALESAQQAAASNAVAAAALARKLEGAEGVRVTRLEVDVAGCGVLSGREEWETGAAVEVIIRGARGGGEQVGKVPTAATLAPFSATSPASPKPPLKKRASRLSFLFGGSSSSSSSSPSPSRRASSFVPSPSSPISPPPPMSPTLTVPRLRTSISLDDLRRGASGSRPASGGEGGGLYALGEEAWGSSGSVRSG